MRFRIMISGCVLCGVMLMTSLSFGYERGHKDLEKVTLFNRTTDYFATFGMTQGDKNKIIYNRKKSRRKYRYEKSLVKKQKEYKKLVDPDNPHIGIPKEEEKGFWKKLFSKD